MTTPRFYLKYNNIYTYFKLESLVPLLLPWILSFFNFMIADYSRAEWQLCSPFSTPTITNSNSQHLTPLVNNYLLTFYVDSLNTQLHNMFNFSAPGSITNKHLQFDRMEKCLWSSTRSVSEAFLAAALSKSRIRTTNHNSKQSQKIIKMSEFLQNNPKTLEMKVLF